LILILEVLSVNKRLHAALICGSILLFFVALYFFRVLLGRADTSAEVYLRDCYLSLGLFLFALSIGLGVWAIFIEFPHDPALKFHSKRIGCVGMALLIVICVATPILVRMLSSIH
jgi:hypothetical protein